MEMDKILTISISDDVPPWAGHKWGACCIESLDMTPAETKILGKVFFGYGDTPLEAAANLLNRLASEEKRFSL